MKAGGTASPAVQTTATGYQSRKRVRIRPRSHRRRDRRQTDQQCRRSGSLARITQGNRHRPSQGSRPAEEAQRTDEDISNREELHIVSMETQKYADLATEWFSLVEAATPTQRAKSSGECDFGSCRPCRAWTPRMVDGRLRGEEGLPRATSPALAGSFN